MALETSEVTVNDAICAYLILIMSKHLFLTEDKYIRRAYIYVNHQDVTDSLALQDYGTSAIMLPLSLDFPNSISLSS